MSGPTKGMVAGQPIQTGVVTDEYREAHGRMFGETKGPQRGRYVFDETLGKCVRVDEDWTDTPRRAQVATEGIVYNNLQATDGTDISTKKKHRDYMKKHGLAMTSDFTEHWKKTKAEREAVRSGDADTKERREIIGRTIQEFREKARRKR